MVIITWKGWKAECIKEMRAHKWPKSLIDTVDWDAMKDTYFFGGGCPYDAVVEEMAAMQ